MMLADIKRQANSRFTARINRNLSLRTRRHGPDALGKPRTRNNDIVERLTAAIVMVIVGSSEQPATTMTANKSMTREFRMT
jgi:hypothetical protein